MGFKINKVKVDLCSYPHYMLLAPRKFGKTTFWDNLVKHVWGSEDKGLLISFGNEEGFHALDGIQVEVAKDWNRDFDEETELRGFQQIVDDIVENNKEYGIKGICFDTLDTMVEVATREIYRLHKKEKGTSCKSLNDAFGGFNRGATRLLELINEQIARLRSIGIAVFILCHTKMKERTDVMSGEKYEQLTNNLQDNIYTAIADTAQMIMVGTLEREIVNGKIVNENRVIYLRGTSTVDAGGRFNGLPEKIDLSPKSFMDAFEIGVKNSLKNPVDGKQLEKMKKEELKERSKAVEIAIKKDKELKENNEDDRADLVKIIIDKFPSSDEEVKVKAKDLLASSGCKKFTDEDIPISILKEIVSVLN